MTGSPPTPGRSAVIVPIELPDALGIIRASGDRMAARGVPPHVTILFPFLPADALTSVVRAALADVATHGVRFRARFDRVHRFDGIVWLLPADQQPFLELTAAVVARWPDHPPYEGVHDELIAHLTLVESSDVGILDAAEAGASAVGPFEAVASEIRVITEDGTGWWQPRWRLPFKPAP